MAEKKAWKKFQAFFVFWFGPELANPGLPDGETPLIVFSGFGKPMWRNWQTR